MTRTAKEDAREGVYGDNVEGFHIQISEESFLCYVQKLIASGACACIIRRKVVLWEFLRNVLKQSLRFAHVGKQRM